MARQTCPRCGGSLKKLSGFIICSKCGHKLGDQNLDIDWSIVDDRGVSKAKDADAQVRHYKGNYQRRRNPLNFEDD